ncbi:hypothetical protein GH714_006699 [Hevea brasiliensis]|uniref:Uncharacterized protein n=1 Tax=Hevea brasiliensis TaxID=3981 RepID=A0A6A6LX41_HEVBR|nr:hypothetical protein GH714_006699 [Hevea brasiliensis]
MGDDDEALSVAELASGHEDASKVTKKHFKDISYDCFGSETSCSQQLVVYIDSKNDRDLLMNCISYSSSRILVLKVGGKLVKQKGRDDFKAAIGFLHVIDLLSSAQRLIVGHNCILVFVQFSKAELVFEFLVLKASLERSNDAISFLHPLLKLLEGGNTCAAGYEIYKEICSSPITKVLFTEQAGTIGIRWKTKLVVSKSEAQSQQQESFSEENAATITSVSSEQVKVADKQPVIDDLLSGQSRCDEFIDFFPAEVKQIRATN